MEICSGSKSAIVVAKPVLPGVGASRPLRRAGCPLHPPAGAPSAFDWQPHGGRAPQLLPGIRPSRLGYCPACRPGNSITVAAPAGSAGRAGQPRLAARAPSAVRCAASWQKGHHGCCRSYGPPPAWPSPDGDRKSRAMRIRLRSGAGVAEPARRLDEAGIQRPDHAHLEAQRLPRGAGLDARRPHPVEERVREAVMQGGVAD